jgi:hypothetical protein
MVLPRSVFAPVLILALASTARADEGWRIAARGAVLVKTRPVPGSAVQEIWAEGDLRAPVRDLQDALLDSESFPRFMPYAKEARRVGEPAPDGTCFVYARVAPPVVANRDYVVQVKVERSVDANGGGWFQNRWSAVQGWVAPVPGVVRMAVNEGTWTVTPISEGLSHVVYRFRIDPGGWIPPFLADLGNQSGVPDVFRAVEREAQRRTEARALVEQGTANARHP